MLIRHIAGVDEVGRGPLAGPVAVGVVMVPSNFPMSRLKGVADSKRLSPQAREKLYDAITSMPEVTWRVAMVGPSTVDDLGITKSIKVALTRALHSAKVSKTSSQILLDGGLHAPLSYQHQKTIIRGDSTELLIGAASIVAKVTRDRYMVRLHAQYPEYAFNEHKGYGTKAHIMTIRSYGLTKQHRRTFCSNILI